MGLEHDEFERLEFLKEEIIKGWLLYGMYMESKASDDPVAKSIKSILEKLTEEKAALELKKAANDVVTFVATHDGVRP